jgi:hypothetical protein
VWVSALRRVSIDSDTLTSLFVVVQKCPLMVKAKAFLIQYITYVWMLQMPTAFYATFAMDALRSGGWPCACSYATLGEYSPYMAVLIILQSEPQLNGTKCLLALQLFHPPSPFEGGMRGRPF